MFKEIIHAFRHRNVVAELIEKMQQMLDAGRWMFDQATDALLRRADWQEIRDPLYERDREINRIEQQVREQIVTHLSVNQPVDLAPCLAVMSVVKDAERIGDYCKNIFEVAKFHQREFTHPEYSVTLEDIREKVLPLFDEAHKAFVEADADLAYQILDTASTARGRCDVIIRQLLSVHEQLAPDEAVAYVLLARFYKRVAAHLANIALATKSRLELDPKAERFTNNKKANNLLHYKYRKPWKLG